MRTVLKKATILFVVMMMIGGIMQVNAFAANVQTNTIEYNVPTKAVPYIYCYDASWNSTLLKSGNQNMPANTETVYMYFVNSMIDINKMKTTVTADGTPLTRGELSWSSANDGYYTVLSFRIANYSHNRVEVNIDFNYQTNFSVKVRQIVTGNNENSLEVEKQLNENPAQYTLYNDDKSLVFTAKGNTGIDSDTNFVEWNKTVGIGDYFQNNNRTALWNLPAGHYTVMQTSVGGTDLMNNGNGSSSAWLQSSSLKTDKATGNNYYEFTVNDENLNKWMEACAVSNEARSLFYGFYTEKIPEKKYSVLYNGNGNTSGQMNDMTDIKSGTEISLQPNAFVRNNYTFIGWNTVANPVNGNLGKFYNDQAKINIEDNLTLYAQWVKNNEIIQNVYIHDLTANDDNLELVNTKTTEKDDLAYSETELINFASTYVKEGYLYTGYAVEVKRAGSDNWVSYQTGMQLQDKSEIRYILTIDKDLTKTKEISYNVEHWLEGDMVARDIETISKNIWIHEDDAILSVEEINIKDYAGYTFAGYNPQNLPTTIKNGAVIKVNYTKNIIPIIPENPEPPVIILPTDTPTVVPPTIPTNTVVIAPNRVPTTNIQDNDVVEDLTEGNTPTEEIIENDVPLASPAKISTGNWALVNLICTVLTIILALIAIVSKHSKDEKETVACDKQETQEYQRRRWTKVLATAVALISIVVFILTENITLPMIMTDQWTLVMAVIMVIQVVILVISKKWKKDDHYQTTNEYNS